MHAMQVMLGRTGGEHVEDLKRELEIRDSRLEVQMLVESGLD